MRFNVKQKPACSTLRNNQGVSLVIALVILLVLTLIGISAISTTTFETNIAGNERLYNRAFTLRMQEWTISAVPEALISFLQIHPEWPIAQLQAYP